MIRSTKHYFNDYANRGKKEIIISFLQAYRIACQNYIDYIWNTEFRNDKNEVIFDTKADILNFLPKYLDYNSISFQTKLCFRALCAALCQALGIVRGTVEQRRKLLYIIKKRKEAGLPTDYYEKRLEKKTISKPTLKENFSAELSTKNVEFEKGSKRFDDFIRLGSTGFGIIHVPIKHHSRDKRWLKHANCKKLAGVLISHNCIQIRYELPEPEKKTEGTVVGADTGLNTILTLSDGTITPQTDCHGHSLNSICEKLSKKKKDSNGFKRAQAHRLNFINWSIKQINLDNIKEIRLEKVDNIFYGKNTSKKLKRWTNADIEKQVIKLGEENGVRIILQPPAYKSQRCSGCGLVRKANRKGKVYCCKECGLNIDSDLNSAKNNSLDLPNIPFALRRKELNKQGFFWKENGLFNLDGQELRVPDTDK